MKPWLVVFHLVPRPPSSRGEEIVRGQRTGWGAQRPLPPDFPRRVAALGLLPDVGDEGAPRAWGRADGNRLEIRESGGAEVTVQVAVDTRKLDPGFAAGLLALVKASNAVLVRSDGLMIDGTVGAFSKALRSSSAWEHVHDPTGLLTGREPLGDEDDR